MVEKKVPFDKQKILDIMDDFPTPFHIYDEQGIRDNARRFKNAFSILPGFKEFFAVKACPNPYIIKILKQEGFGADCSSLPELILSEKSGIVGENIIMSSNDTPIEEFIKCKKLGGIINLDDISHIEFLEKNSGLPNLICFRYNPGPTKKGNAIIGDPKEAKYGFTKQQMIEGYKLCKEKGVRRFGMHTMVVSNEQELIGLRETAKMMFSLALEVKKETGIEVEFINLGGGIGTPYEPDKPNTLNYEDIAKAFKEEYNLTFTDNFKPKIYLECGRTITGPFGWLITKVRHLKHTYKDYVGTDASMANLMRPGMYGAYHHIEVLGKEVGKKEFKYDITGSLCENNDKFAIDRLFPKIDKGDILVIYNAGAHGHAMGFNYNGKLRSSELLLRQDGSVEEIRRAETVEDYFATLNFEKLENFN
jgi:diaminopimelate decarboxylase